MIFESLLPDLAGRTNVVFIEKGFGIGPTGKFGRPRAHVGGLTVIIDIAVCSTELLRSGKDHETFVFWHFNMSIAPNRPGRQH